MTRIQRLPLLAAAASLLTAATLAHDVVGVLADRGAPGDAGREPFVHVFDPDTLEITASIPIPVPNFSAVFDVEISPDLSEAYVSEFTGSKIWIVDLEADPPALASGTNPIDLTAALAGSQGDSAVEDIALTDDGRFLIAGTGNGLNDGGSAFAVVDLHTRTVTDRVDFSPGSPIAVDVGPDDSVYVAELIESSATSANTNIRRYRLTSEGHLVDTGDVADVSVLPGAHNILVPDYPFLPPFLNRFLSRHVTHVSRPAGQTLGSLRTNGLSASDSLLLDFPTGIDLNFDPLRSILYVRTNEQGTPGPAGAGNSQIDGYRFSPFSGRIFHRVVSIPLDRKAGTAFGAEQTALDPVLRRLYVSGLGNGEVRVFDSMTGAQIGTMTDPDFLFGLGIRVRRSGL